MTLQLGIPSYWLLSTYIVDQRDFTRIKIWQMYSCTPVRIASGYYLQVHVATFISTANLLKHFYSAAEVCSYEAVVGGQSP